MIIKYFLKSFIFANRIKLIKEKKELYKRITATKDIKSYQVKKFNIIWGDAINNNSFYKMWQKKHNLPDKINNINDLKNFPILTKKDIQNNQDLIFKDLKNYSTVSTGGSTGEPTKFPVGKIEQDLTYANNYMAKSWWGLEPLDKILLFWGHSHLFGSGIKGKINQYKRVLSDWLINTKRLNAYDMSIDTLDKYYQELKTYNPKFIIGYTSSIYKLAKYIKENNLQMQLINLKGIIVTSESVTEYDIKLIEGVFKVPCIIEYGMAETGVIAYSTNNDNNIKVFWDSFIAREIDESLYVTTLTDKLFPLINYQTDDLVKTDDSVSILNISKIAGRTKDILKLKVGNKILELSGILMVHVLKSYKGIFEIQFKQLPNSRIKILFTASKKLNTIGVEEFFIKNISQDHSEIKKGDFEFEQVKNIEKTIAGKAKWIEKEK
ncbi:MAG: hypothetical protein DRQ51_04260 [Gammaproteobacteria bacterium]|nr:MAG: hypothetical protein DRQ51_04260 [Gammaproteobacteria bacterium]